MRCRCETGLYENSLSRNRVGDVLGFKCSTASDAEQQIFVERRQRIFLYQATNIVFEVVDT